MDKRPTSSSKRFEQNSNEEVFKTIYRSHQTAAIQEKRELKQLNDRFASYIERVRFLEDQNQKLQIEINHLRKNWNSKSDPLKQEYSTELNEARQIIDDTAKDRTLAELRAKHAQQQTNQLIEQYNLLLTGRDSDRNQIELLEKELLDNEADLHLFHRRLIDLEDEREHFHQQSQKFISDYEHLINDLDHETIRRIQFENQKQNLQNEIQFLNDIHFKQIEELKQMNSCDRNNDFLRNQLAQTIRNIRHEYEQLNNQQKNDLQLWYHDKVSQAMQEIQSYETNRKRKINSEHKEIEQLKTLVSDSENDIRRMRQRNEELESRVIQLENLIQNQRINNRRANEERDWKIKELHLRLDNLGRDYDKLVSTRTSLNSEILIYRRLIEDEEKRSSTFGRNSSRITSYPHSNQGFCMSYQPTIFDQVYGTYPQQQQQQQQRPNSICLTDTNNYRWNSNDINNRKLKTRTCFEIGHLREQYQSKVVTPPSSDYTDAYLAAFAPKSVPTRRIYRISAPVFANVVPLRTFSSMNNPIKTSETRFNSINHFPHLNYSSSLVPNIFPKTQASPTKVNTERSFKTISPTPPLSCPSTSRESSSISTHSSSPSLSIYRPAVSFQSVPSTTPDKHIDRPKSLLFKPDENLRSPSIDQPSTIVEPSIMPSKPIQILEQTVKKYDSVIDQISEILAIVSPLSSTVDSMSPSKSALDYEFTSDGSPILHRKQINIQQSTPTVKHSILQRMQGKHLIREDSYDKIITAIADLDNEITDDVIEEEKESTNNIEMSNIAEQSIQNKSSTTISEKSLEVSSSLDTTSPISDEDDRPITSSDVNNSRSSSESIDNNQSIAHPAPIAIVLSPIDTLDDTISTRFISSDVYHGYLGDHKQFNQVDQDVTKISQLVSLRRTIATPVTPIIETIQGVVSSMRSVIALQLSEKSVSPLLSNTDEHQSSTETVQVQSCPSEDNEQILSQISDDGLTLSADSQLSLDNRTMKEDASISETNEFMSSYYHTNNDGVEMIVDETLHDIIETLVAQNDDVTQSSGIELQLNPCREPSPSNADLDSFELMRALRGHSIRLPDSLEKYHQVIEKSPSTTTTTTSSPHVTSSDRYISYAIHQMGDSSQERLPALPLAADLPIYKPVQEKVLLKKTLSKDDDLTEFDATDNLTSYSDDLVLQKCQSSKVNQDQHFDASSTDEDVDDEIETNLEHLVDKLNLNDETYQHYEQATTPSSNDSSSSSSKPQQQDDIYFIPGYVGLWRPSSESKCEQSSMVSDDEKKSNIKTRTIVRTLDSTRRPLAFQSSTNPTENIQTGVPIRPDTINLFNRTTILGSPLDKSESESYQTCQSSISKPLEKISTDSEQPSTSSDESIFLLHERERGVSLPITMKINYDDLALRLSTSSPMDNKFYSKRLQDLSSPSTHSEPPLSIQTDTNSHASSPSCSDQQKLPSWLNTVNTVTTTTEGTDGLIESLITYDKSAKGPLSITECHPQGYYIVLENSSRSKTIDLFNWQIHQEDDTGACLDFRFPSGCILKPKHSLKILTANYQIEQNIDEQIISTVSSWFSGSNILTTLMNPEGKECATLTKRTTIPS